MGERGPVAAFNSKRGEARRLAEKEAAKRARPADGKRPECREAAPSEVHARWGAVVSELIDCGVVLHQADSELIERLLSTRMLYEQTEKLLAADGLVIRTDAGLKAHPMMSERRRLGADLAVIEASLGMTPSARKRLRCEPPVPEEEENSWWTIGIRDPKPGAAK